MRKGRKNNVLSTENHYNVRLKVNLNAIVTIDIWRFYTNQVYNSYRKVLNLTYSS